VTQVDGNALRVSEQVVDHEGEQGSIPAEEHALDLARCGLEAEL
jgi:hypothetical protein